MPRLSTAVANHWKRLKRSNGISATMIVDDVFTPVTIVLARADSQSVSTREAVFIAGLQDVLIDKADRGSMGEPQEGETYVYVENDETVTAEARPPDQNTPCFIRWNGNAVYRVHCKVVSRVAVG